MGSFPRSVFSENELEATRWFAQKTGVRNLTHVKQVKEYREKILNVAGLESTTHDGQLGHLYTLNNLETILAHVVVSTSYPASIY